MTSGYFPEYIPGESIYGLISRFHIGQPSHSWKNTNKAIFDQDYIRLHPVLPCHLNQIASFFSTTTPQLIKQGTGFPLFSVMQKSTVWSNNLKSAMLGECGDTVVATASISSSKLPFKASLKYCIECRDHDLKKYGVALWHTKHLLYGVSICPIHNQLLNIIQTGDGGINHKYLLPDQLNDAKQCPVSSRASYISKVISDLYDLCCDLPENTLQPFDYEGILRERGFLTKCHRIRWQALRTNLELFWKELFISEYYKALHPLADFHFVPGIVHSKRQAHYFKHALLIGYLSNCPRDLLQTNSNVTEPEIIHARPADNTDLELLKQGCSLREISRISGKSVGYLKQLAIRNRLPVQRRRKTITEQCELSIIRLAYMGIHRQEIADIHNISTGAVEQIIQSQRGLSEWRRHLKTAFTKARYRVTLSNLITKKSSINRKTIRSLLSKEYIWLYKNDRGWLESTLPEKEKYTYHPSIDWAKRDIELTEKIKTIEYAESIAEIDRFLGGHCWLTRYRDRLPLATAEAYKKIEAGNK